MKRSALQRGKPMRSRPKPKRQKPLIAKRLGESAVDKQAHLRSAEHVALVKAQPCLVSRTLGREYVAHHHPDELYPHLVAQQRKISDFLSVPLAHNLHQGPGSLHGDRRHPNSARWWTVNGCAPARVYAWTKAFLRRHYKPGHPGADYALEQIRIVEERADGH